MGAGFVGSCIGQILLGRDQNVGAGAHQGYEVAVPRSHGGQSSQTLVDAGQLFLKQVQMPLVELQVAGYAE